MKQIKLTAPSGYSAVVNADKCTACGTCVEVCPYDAREVIDIEGKKKLRTSTELCMGCGACVSVCPQGASSLKVDPDKGEIFDMTAIMELAEKAASKV